jgi:hypothetical protein
MPAIVDGVLRVEAWFAITAYLKNGGSSLFR